jgi:nucleoid DNA-binding protein
MAKSSAPKKPLTKTELVANIAAATDVPKKEVAAVMEPLANENKKSLSNKGPGMIAIPGLVKIEKKKVPARPAQTGVPNPESTPTTNASRSLRFRSSAAL